MPEMPRQGKQPPNRPLCGARVAGDAGDVTHHLQ